MTTWPEILDDIERRNKLYRTFLESGSGELPAFLPPANVGPLPPEHQARAQSLLDESRALEASVSEMKDSVASLLLPRSASYETSTSSVLNELA